MFLWAYCYGSYGNIVTVYTVTLAYRQIPTVYNVTQIHYHIAAVYMQIFLQFTF